MITRVENVDKYRLLQTFIADFCPQMIPICVQMHNLEPEAGQAGHYGKGSFQFGTAECNLVSEYKESDLQGSLVIQKLLYVEGGKHQFSSHLPPQK